MRNFLCVSIPAVSSINPQTSLKFFGLIFDEKNFLDAPHQDAKSEMPKFYQHIPIQTVTVNFFHLTTQQREKKSMHYACQ